MLSNEEMVIDELFGTPGEPDWAKIGNLLQEDSEPFMSAWALMRLVWMESHDPEMFDSVICELVQ